MLSPSDTIVPRLWTAYLVDEFDEFVSLPAAKVSCGSDPGC